MTCGIVPVKRSHSVCAQGGFDAKYLKNKGEVLSMLPYDSIVRPLIGAQLLLCLPIFLLGFAMWRQKRAEGKLETQAPLLSRRSRSSKIGAIRWAQGFCLGMMVALAGTAFFLLHERSRLSNTRSVRLQVNVTERSTPR